LPVFKTGALNHSATLPSKQFQSVSTTPEGNASETIGTLGPNGAQTCFHLPRIVHEPTQTEYAAITAAYGTGFENLARTELTNNLLIRGHECQKIGLHKETVFKLDLENRKRLPWAEEYFVPQGYIKSQGIVAGSLDAQQRKFVLACFEARELTFPLP
jgi:hypothetical protein